MRLRTGRITGVFIAAITALSACGTATDGQAEWRAGDEPVAPVSAASPTPSASPSPEPVSDEQVPEAGDGAYDTARGSNYVIGKGQTLITYRVEVERGVDWGDLPKVMTDDFAARIEEVLEHPQSWPASADHPVTEPEHGVHGASWRFQRVSGPQYKVRIRLASPATVDAVCRQVGLDTEGKYSCKTGNIIMINLRRWLQGSGVASVDDYPEAVINHEMGHYLGFDHQGCSGPGELAPIMMQQSIDLDGCEPNLYPFTKDGEFVSGPYLPS
ncbi:hypothetical protein J2S43_007207 [Catenuloplanes nepalensis]|uniref:DUF3152 domain-containing protein n=1 Tax=Catenuloplanes nepalensis TaxID=587533 RepID=A0ABT9N4Q9_9ACTN|nr:DUF3152 domain-containing protein [Catenuloplanes nepalensis]MDP9798695.1 hypothetical protein [Catenuloplanes nepalensis]